MRLEDASIPEDQVQEATTDKVISLCSRLA